MLQLNIAASLKGNNKFLEMVVKQKTLSK